MCTVRLQYSLQSGNSATNECTFIMFAYLKFPYVKVMPVSVPDVTVTDTDLNFNRVTDVNLMSREIITNV